MVTRTWILCDGVAQWREGELLKSILCQGLESRTCDGRKIFKILMLDGTIVQVSRTVRHWTLSTRLLNKLYGLRVGIHLIGSRLGFKLDRRG